MSIAYPKPRFTENLDFKYSSQSTFPNFTLITQMIRRNCLPSASDGKIARA
jgi:hypothetical protein